MKETWLQSDVPDPPELAALRKLQAQLDDEVSAGLDFTEALKQAQELGISATEAATRGDLARLLATKIADVVHSQHDTSPAPSSTQDEPARTAIRPQGMNAHPEEYRRSYIASMPEPLREILMEQLARRSAADAAHHMGNIEQAAMPILAKNRYIETLTLENPLLLDGLHIDGGIGELRTAKGRIVGLETTQLFFATRRSPPVVIELKWKKMSHASTATTRMGQMNNCCAILSVVDLFTNEPMAEFVLPPIYPPNFALDTFATQIFSGSAEYGFTPQAIAARLHAAAASAREMPPRSESENSPGEETAISAPMDSDQFWRSAEVRAEKDKQWRQKYSLAHIPGGKAFRNVWKSLPWKQDLQTLASRDVDTLLQMATNRDSSDIIKYVEASAPHFSAGLRGRGR